MVKQGKVINVDSAFIFLMIGLVWSGKLTRMIWIQNMKGLMGSLKIHLWMAYLAIMPLFIYSRIVRCHACPQAPVERRAIICLERICKKRQKRTKVYFRNAQKTFCLNFFHFCRCRLNQVLRSSEQLLSNKLVSLFAKSLESQVEVVEFDLEALLRVYTYESTDSN